VAALRLSVRDVQKLLCKNFHAGQRRRIKVVHPNLFTFLGHLQRTTADTDAVKYYSLLVRPSQLVIVVKKQLGIQWNGCITARKANGQLCTGRL